MSNIIKERKRIETSNNQVAFRWRDCPGAGFSFDADKDFNVLTDRLHPLGLENYRKCIDGTHDVDGPFKETYRNAYMEPADLLCDCGETVQLYGNTNTCPKCHRDYNMSGQLLAPRSQWGWDTGESLSEILSIP